MLWGCTCGHCTVVLTMKTTLSKESAGAAIKPNAAAAAGRERGRAKVAISDWT